MECSNIFDRLVYKDVPVNPCPNYAKLILLNKTPNRVKTQIGRSHNVIHVCFY